MVTFISWRTIRSIITGAAKKVTCGTVVYSIVFCIVGTVHFVPLQAKDFGKYENFCLASELGLRA